MHHRTAKHEYAKRLIFFNNCFYFCFATVVGAWKEPIPGWTISKNGPQGFIMGAAKGVIRRLPVGKQLIYDYIPVDVVVNQLLVAGFHAGTCNSPKKHLKDAFNGLQSKNTC